MISATARITARPKPATKLQADLDAWLVHYATERSHLGYRNRGHRPFNRGDG